MDENNKIFLSEYERGLNALRASVRNYRLTVLIWGASENDLAYYKERCQLREYLKNEGYDAIFSEEHSADPNRLKNPIHDETLQAIEADAIVILYGCRGTQDEVSRILFPNHPLFTKTIVIIAKETKNKIPCSVSSTDWQNLFDKALDVHEFDELPLGECVFRAIANKLQLLREKKGLDKLPLMHVETGYAETMRQEPAPSLIKQTEVPQPVRVEEGTEGKYFYEKAKILDKLTRSPSPTNLECLLKIIDKDESLAVYFYGGRDYKTYPDFGWVGLLFEAGEFEDLNVLPENGRLTHRCKASFLREAAKEKSEAVFEIITSIKPREPWIQAAFIEALESMPEDLLLKGLRILWDIIGERKHRSWYVGGEAAAKIMEKLMGKNPNAAFAIARLLLETWTADDGNACARFDEYHYAEFIKEHYSQLSEAYPYRAFRLLVKLLDEYLDEAKQKSGADRDSYFYVTVEDIEKGSHWGFDTWISIYINALRDCLGRVIAKEPEAIDKTAELLKNNNRAIFRRFEIYLLGKIQGSTYCKRINEIAVTKEYFQEACYRNEYNKLLVAKKDLLESQSKEKIMGWVNEKVITDKEGFDEWFSIRHKRNPSEEDYEKCENENRATRLYPIREVFPDKYENYKMLSGATDDELKPLSMHSEGRGVAEDEGTPLTTEEMLKKSAEEVLVYVSNKKNYNYEPEEHQWNTPEEALGGAFKAAVKTRPVDYMRADIELILNLPATFLSRYFRGLCEATTDGFDWDRYLKIAGGGC